MHDFGLLVAATASDPRFQIRVTEEMIRHSRIRDILYFAGFAYGIGVLLLVLFSGLSAKLRDVATRVARKPRFVTSMIYVALFVMVTSLLELPLSFYSGYVVPHQFNLSNLDLGEWFREWLKAVAVGVVISAIGGALVLFAMQRFRRWWI